MGTAGVIIQASTDPGEDRLAYTKFAKYVDIKPVVLEGFPDAHNVFLKVTNQTFCVTPYGCETKEEAEWFRDMLCIALMKVATETTPDVAKERTSA